MNMFWIYFMSSFVFRWNQLLKFLNNCSIITCIFYYYYQPSMQQKGYDKSRFPVLQGDAFDCYFCGNIVNKPKECQVCHKLYCSFCIDTFCKQNGKKTCADQCNLETKPMASKLLMKIYNKLEIRCKFPDCKKVVKLCELEKHQLNCGKPQCWNYVYCQTLATFNENGQGFCSPECAFVRKLLEFRGDQKKIYDELNKNQKIVEVQPVIVSVNEFKQGSAEFKWDANKIGLGVEITEEGLRAFLSESGYTFRSVIADVGFTGGVHYWQLEADTRTQNQLKIGVTTNKDFELNSAFSDYAFGWCYYGLGNLRHNSNSTGPAYGKRFKEKGTLGVCLNMDKGTLSFALDGQFWGIAYRDELLKKGPIYPAIAILHCGGCKIKGGNLPQIFKDA